MDCTQPHNWSTDYIVAWVAGSHSRQSSLPYMCREPEYFEPWSRWTLRHLQGSDSVMWAVAVVYQPSLPSCSWDESNHPWLPSGQFERPRRDVPSSCAWWWRRCATSDVSGMRKTNAPELHTLSTLWQQYSCITSSDTGVNEKEDDFGSPWGCLECGGGEVRRR